MINFLEITEECVTILQIIYFVRELLEIVCIIVPIGLIVMLSIDFGKGVISSDEKSSKIVSLVTKRIIYAVVIFLLPETIFGVLNVLLVNQTDESYACWKFAGEASIEQVNELVAEQEEALAKHIEELEAEAARKRAEKIAAKKQYKNTVTSLSNQNGTSSADGTVIGQTYDLTDQEIRAIARQCEEEQGVEGALGIAFEASQMANQWELGLYGIRNKYSGLYDFIRNSGWYNLSITNMNDYKNAKQTSVDAVTEVLVHGKRKLPLYVDEHDCIYCGEDYGYNVEKIDNNGKVITNSNHEAILNHKNYERDVTKIYNTYDSMYTFHTFVSDYKYSDPFGYTDEAMKRFKELQGQ